MPDAVSYLGIEDDSIDMWDPRECNWYTLNVEYGCLLADGEKYVLLRKQNIGIKDIWEEIRLCTEAGDEVLTDSDVRDFTDQYRDVV